MRRLLISLALLLGLATAPPTARAQTPNPNEAELATQPAEEGGSSGDPLYGYVGTAFLAAGAIFVVCKSARR